MAKRFLIALTVFALTSCGNRSAHKALLSDASSEPVKTVNITEAAKDVEVPPFAPPAPETSVAPRSVHAAAPPPGEPTPTATAPLHTGAASIAYSYKLAFELPARRIDAALTAHRAACEALGPASCQVLNSSRTGGQSDAASASLEMRIVPAVVKAFTAQLEATTANVGGSLLENSTIGEDLTRQLIDADAGLKAKRTLRDRLQDLLAHHHGNLTDLLEVEKSLSETQQELDTATAELAELQQRVSFSKLDVSYRSEQPIGSTTARPLADAIANASETISASLATMLTLALTILPWLLPLALIVFLVRRWRRGRSFSRRAKPPPPL